MTTRRRIAEIQNPADRKHFVYRVFDVNGDLLYVGCSNNPWRRWNEHRTDRPLMTSQAHRFKLAGPYSYHTARRLEREALTTENPRYGMTPTRRGQHSRNSALQRQFGPERADREAPIDRSRWLAR